MLVFDLALFEQLNEEYQSRPLVDVVKLTEQRILLAPRGDDLPLKTKAERVQAANDQQLTRVAKDVAVDGRRVLELGCGSGYLSRALLEYGGASSVVGIDIERRSTWNEAPDPRLTFIEGDLASQPLVEPESVDLVVSTVVLEHVTRPLQMLAAIRDVLVEGGTAWLRFNLYPGCNASHRYREVFFPWPHLLFADEVVRQFYERHHNRPDDTIVWVNRMTAAHYLLVCQNLGFEIETVRRTVVPIDIPFYLRFEDTLGRYAALDLETTFLKLVLHKRPQTELTDIAVAGVNYLARQHYLDRRILLHRRARAEKRKP